LRKVFLVAAAATTTLAFASTSVAQAPAEGTFKASATPSKAGTKKKPKNVKLSFSTEVTTPNASAGTIQIKLPKQLKLSGKGFKRCNADDLVAFGVSACESAKAGPKGLANALVGPASSPTKTPLVLDVYPFVENDSTIMFYLDQQGGEYANVVHGKITNGGSTITIELPIDVRQPVPQLDASLVSIAQTFSGTRKGKYIVSSTGCANKKWKIGANITFSQRADLTPPPGTMSKSTTVRCKK